MEPLPSFMLHFSSHVSDLFQHHSLQAELELRKEEQKRQASRLSPGLYAQSDSGDSWTSEDLTPAKVSLKKKKRKPHFFQMLEYEEEVIVQTPLKRPRRQLPPVNYDLSSSEQSCEDFATPEFGPRQPPSPPTARSNPPAHSKKEEGRPRRRRPQRTAKPEPEPAPPVPSTPKVSRATRPTRATREKRQRRGQVGGGRKKGSHNKEATKKIEEWLLAHFWNPYPSPEEFFYLSHTSGMTEKQVSWFCINYRNRKWKFAMEERISKGEVEDLRSMSLKALNPNNPVKNFLRSLLNKKRS